MRFTDILNTGHWTVGHRNLLLRREDVSALVSFVVAQLAPEKLDPEVISVFCVFSPIEMFVAYFVASRLGLLAAIGSPRTLPILVEGLNTEVIGCYIIPAHARKYPVLPEVRIVRPDFCPSNTADVRVLEGPTSTASARFVFCSSGSTGTPKRIVHSEDRLIANARMVSDYLGLNAEDRTFCVFPISYMYGLSTTLCSLLTSGHIEYGEFLNSSLLAHQTDETRTTVLPIIGDWAYRLAEAWSGHALPARRVVLNASDRLLRGQADALLPYVSALWNNFGQTEAGPRLFATQLTRDNIDSMSHADVIAPGYLTDHKIETKISPNIDTSGFGALSYRTPYSMISTLSPCGVLTQSPEWIDSGDLFRREADGLYRWGGRVAHIIKQNGLFVSLRGIADSLLLHRLVSGVGFGKDLHGQLTFFVESETGGSQLEQELMPIISSQLRGHGAKVCVLPKLPRTESGKIDSKRLEAVYNGVM